MKRSDYTGLTLYFIVNALLLVTHHLVISRKQSVVIVERKVDECNCDKRVEEIKRKAAERRTHDRTSTRDAGTETD